MDADTLIQAVENIQQHVIAIVTTLGAIASIIIPIIIKRKKRNK